MRTSTSAGGVKTVSLFIEDACNAHRRGGRGGGGVGAIRGKKRWRGSSGRRGGRHTPFVLKGRIPMNFS